MIARWSGAAGLALSLAGCAVTGAGPDTPAATPAATCQADGVQSMIGHAASAALGMQLLRETGAATLRWAPPRSAMTMDFRPDRLTVGYDDDMRIMNIVCG